MTVVLDASVLLSILFREARAREAEPATYGAAISTVNLAEVVSKVTERGYPAARARQLLSRMAIAVHPLSEDDAFLAGELRTPTRSAGLSLGDRGCLALARRLDGAVLTTDRAWQRLDLGLDIRVIR